MREGHDWAFEVLFNRYQPRLLAFCRRMVGSPQDAEDVLQEVFAAAHDAILADDRPINVSPWLYRIARNRAVNHLRRRLPAADGIDSMDVHAHENGTSTLERVQQREELRAIIADVHELPKTQRTALVLREIDDLTYGDIAQTMGKSLPSVKSLLIRARTSLAESSAGRAALAPLGLLALLRKLIPAKLGGGSGAGGAAGAAASAGSAGVAGTAATGLGGALGAKAVVGMATAALITAGAVSVDEANLHRNDVTARAGGTAISVITGTTGWIRVPGREPVGRADGGRGHGRQRGRDGRCRPWAYRGCRIRPAACRPDPSRPIPRPPRRPPAAWARRRRPPGAGVERRRRIGASACGPEPARCGLRGPRRLAEAPEDQGVAPLGFASSGNPSSAPRTHAGRAAPLAARLAGRHPGTAVFGGSDLSDKRG